MALEDEKLALNASPEERKEEFASGMSDQKLLEQIKDWEKESEGFYSNLKRVWDENLDYYKGNQTGVSEITGKFSKAVENRIFMAVETAIPIATSRLPDVIVKPGQDDEQSILDAGDHQDVLNYHFERVQIQALAERWVRDVLTKRYGVFKAGWSQREDDVEVKVIDPRRIRIPAYGKNIDELKFVLEDLELSYDAAVLYFGEAKARKLLPTNQQSTQKIRKKTFSVTEVWTNEFVAWRAGDIILDKKDNPYWKKDAENFFTAPKKPYVIKSLFETEESIIGSTDFIQQLKPVQDNINVRKRQIEDITNKVANPILLIDADTMSEEEAAAITNEPGLILYGKQAADQSKIRYEQPGQVPQYLFQDLQFSRTEFDNIWGMHSTTRGEREGRETLGGRQLLREADLGRIDLIARQLERALDEIAEYWTQLIKLFYTEDKAFTILGEDGVRFVKNFSSKNVSPDVKPSVRQGSTLKEDDAAIQQKAILLWQNKAIGLKTLYKMLKFPDMQNAVDDFIQTQSGQLLQQGTSAGGQPVGLPANFQQFSNVTP